MIVRKVLVLRGGALGDFVVTLPALAALRATYPEAVIELIGNATAATLAVNRGLLTRAHSQHDARWSALYVAGDLPLALREWLRGFDVVINFWPDLDGVLASHFPLRPGQQFLSAAAMPTRTPAAAHYCAALDPLGIQANEPSYKIGPVMLEKVEPTVPAGYVHDRPKPARRSGSTSNAIAIHPGSGSRQKNWPAERWVELIARIPGPVVLIRGEAEAETWSPERLAATPLAPRIADGSIRLAVQLPLEELIDVLSRCRLFVGHDSGVSHLAAACDTPCVLLFGPTEPAMWAPPAPHVRVIRRGDDLAAITVEDVLHELRCSFRIHAG